jgi:hypothetical protein
MKVGHARLVITVACGALSCADAREPRRVELPVVVDPRGIRPVQTDRGYHVELSRARLVLDRLELTIAGEASAASIWLRELVLPVAHAHPGHDERGDVTGELPGHFVLDLLDPDALIGVATLIVGAYRSGNFTFGRAESADGLPDADPLLGHSAMFVGVASKAGTDVEFSFVIDAPPGSELIGAPFEVEVTESSPTGLRFELLTLDPIEGDTLFDGIEFDGLPADPGGEARPRVTIHPDDTEPLVVDAYDTFRRTFQTHDHFMLSATAAE